jgi:hypothetical protein
MRKLALATMIFAMSATAADFRALDFGQSCLAIPEWEASHGSSRTRWPAPRSGESYAFSVEQFDHVLVASYICANGSLLTGNYFFPVESWAQAIESYRTTYQALRSIYGDAIIETLPWSRKEDSVPPSITHPRGYMTSWKTPKVSVMMNIGPSEQWEAPGWRVVILEFKAR